MNSRKALILGTLAATALAVPLAYAASRMNEEQNEAQGLAQAKISLVQAIQVAEQHIGGKAASARLEHEHGKFVYEVEVLRGEQATDVKVDIADGKVLSAKADEDEHEQRGEH